MADLHQEQRLELLLNEMKSKERRAFIRGVLLTIVPAVLAGALLFAVAQKLTRASQQVHRLKSGVEATGGNVTAQNEVFQLKASVEPELGIRGEDGKQRYIFHIYLVGSPETLAKIQRVTYEFNHPSFNNRRLESSDGKRFEVSYDGWGCLTRVDVTVYMKGGSKQLIPFDMCNSLGPDWGKTALHT